MANGMNMQNPPETVASQGNGMSPEMVSSMPPGMARDASPYPSSEAAQDPSRAAPDMGAPGSAEQSDAMGDPYRWVIDPLTGGTDMILCHFKPLEYQLMCMIQHYDMELTVGPFAGYGTFPFLRDIFEEKEVKELFYASVGDSPIPALQKLQELALSQLPKISPRESDASPMGQEIADAGKFTHDSKMAFIPQNVTEMLIEANGGVPTFNPETGLLAFGFWKEVGRGLATVAGAIVGGPVGAAVGNFAGRVMTGQDPGKALLPSAKTGALAWGGQQILGAMGGAGGVGEMAAATGANAATQGGAQAAGHAAQKATAASPGILEKLGNTFASSAGSGGGGSGGVGGLGQLGGLGAILGLSYMGSRDTDKKNEQIRNKIREQEWADRERLKAEGKWEPRPPAPPRSAHSGEGNSPYFGYKKGGNVDSPKIMRKKEIKGVSIRGPGKGQADVIYTALRAGDFVTPSDVVSAWGDGSSKAGTQEIAKLVSKYRKGKEIKSPRTSKVAVALSDSEANIPNAVVTALGKGNHAKGVKMLEKAIKNTRKHKQSNGTGLPPKAHSIEQYMK